MKTNTLKWLIMVLMLSLMGTGAAIAGGYQGYYKAPASHGYYQGGSYYHHGSYHPYAPGHWHNRYRYHGPAVRCYPRANYFNRGYGRYDGAYYFSGAFSEPGFGFVFGTHGSW